MLFNSFEFILVFLPAFLLVYYMVLRHSARLALTVIVVASLVFYAWWYPPNLILLAASIVANYWLGHMIELRRGNHAVMRLLLVSGIVINLALLGWFKYASFAIGIADDVFDASLAAPDIVLPLAISFFTFQQVGYLVDVYRGEVRQGGVLEYAAFVTFFPQLIAGPIVKYNELAPQFAQRLSGHAARRPYARDLAVGMSIFAVGLAKKVIFADTLAGFSDPVFSMAAAGQDPTLITAWVGTLAFAFEIYFDFSGYSDMAIGLARMAGFRLPINFNSPYKARNISEFWRRWHMTLTRFFTATVYAPMALALARRAGPEASRPGSWRGFVAITAIPIVVTFVLVGIWHGAGWTFVLFGAVHAAFLTIHRFWETLLVRSRMPGLRRAVARYGRVPGIVITFVAVAVSFVLFRAADLDTAMRLFGNLVGVGGLTLPEAVAGTASPLRPLFDALGARFGEVPYWEGTRHVVWLAVSMVIVFCLPNLIELFRRYRPAIAYRTILRSRCADASWGITSVAARILILVLLADWIVTFFQADATFATWVSTGITAAVALVCATVLLVLPAAAFQLTWREGSGSLVATLAIFLSSVLFLFVGQNNAFIYFQF